MVNSYRRSDGSEGAHTCQKIFCHHSLCSGVAACLFVCLFFSLLGTIRMRHQFIFIERCKRVLCELMGEFVEFLAPTVFFGGGRKSCPKCVAGRSRCPRAQHHPGTGARICMKPGFCTGLH